MPAALSALARLGVELKSEDGKIFRGISFLQGDMKITADFPAGSGLGLRRSVLHERLARRAQASGVKLLWNSPVCRIDDSGACVRGQWIRARWIVGADGYGSRVRHATGLGRLRTVQMRFAKRRHYGVEPWSDYTEVYWGGQAQAYVTPVARDEVCVVLLGNGPKQVKFDAALTEFHELRKRLAGRPLLSRERGAVTTISSLTRVQRNNIALVGDAAGGVDAITGEGLRLAFEQALAVADAIQDGELKRYERFHRRLLSQSRRMARLLLWLGRHPRVRACAFRAMCDKPECFARMLEMHVGHWKAARLITTGASLGWQLLECSED